MLKVILYLIREICNLNYRKYCKPMSRLFLVTLLTSLLVTAYSQRITQITIGSSNSTIISFLVDESVMVNITKDGKIIDWGIEYNTLQTSFYPGKLQKYMGREEYYPSTVDSAYRGKIKYIGRTLITYYTSDENEMFKGKVKTFGSNLIDYYTSYDNAAYKGNVKNAGPVLFTWYGSFDDETYRGKIKTVGSTGITYYGVMDDKAYRGKVKNIDRSVVTYYSSFDRPGYGGAIKSGSPVLYSRGIKYFIQN
jgi:hypothetical protein